jgi:hypothetical protein
MIGHEPRPRKRAHTHDRNTRARLPADTFPIGRRLVLGVAPFTPRAARSSRIHREFIANSSPYDNVAQRTSVFACGRREGD